MIERVTYWRIVRDPMRVSGPDHLHDRLFEMALRWTPDDLPDIYGDPDEPGWLQRGERNLRSLREGGDISMRNLAAALDYLSYAAAYYDDLYPEAYPGRNAEARRDLDALCEALDADVEEAACHG